MGEHSGLRRCAALMAAVGVAACGGGGSSPTSMPVDDSSMHPVSTTPPPPPPPAPAPTPPAPAPALPPAAAGTAAECFNPGMFTAGTQATLDYDIADGGPGSPHGSVTHQVTVQASPGTGAADVVVSTDWLNEHYDLPIPGLTVTRTANTTDVLATDGRRLLIKQSSTRYGNGNLLEEAYEPAAVDARFELSPGTQTQVVRTPQIGTANYSIVTYVGQETVTVPAGTFVACRFEELSVYPGSGTRNEATKWVSKVSGVVVRMGRVSLLGTSRLNGQPIQ